MPEQFPKITSPEILKTTDSATSDEPSWLVDVQRRYEERQVRVAAGIEQEYQNEQWKKWEAKYQERRLHSETVDDGKDSVVRERGDKSWGMQSQIGSSRHIVGQMLRAHDFFSKMLAARPLTDIGAGVAGFNNALAMIGNYTEGGRTAFEEGKYPDLGSTKIILVDPYMQSDLEQGSYDSAEYLRDEEIPEQERVEAKRRIEFKREGGQSYLLKQAPGSTNVMCGAVDEFIVPVQEAQRIAQEIFRVLPEDGFFITYTSEHITEEAQKLFPYHLSDSHIHIFSKSSLPSLQELNELERKQRRERD